MFMLRLELSEDAARELLSYVPDDTSLFTSAQLELKTALEQALLDQVDG